MTGTDRISAGGDPTLWVELHGDLLFRYAITRVRDRGTAEELVQETFLSALRAREQFTGRSAEQTWFVAILRRKIVDNYRKTRRDRTDSAAVSSEADPSSEFDGRGVWTNALGAWPNKTVATDLGRDEFWRTFDDCLAKLPGGAADAFCLREIEELPCEEICKVLGITSSNLWTRLHRARTMLRRCLELNWFERDAS